MTEKFRDFVGCAESKVASPYTQQEIAVFTLGAGEAGLRYGGNSQNLFIPARFIMNSFFGAKHRVTCFSSLVSETNIVTMFRQR